MQHQIFVKQVDCLVRWHLPAQQVKEMRCVTDRLVGLNRIFTVSNPIMRGNNHRNL